MEGILDANDCPILIVSSWAFQDSKRRTMNRETPQLSLFMRYHSHLVNPANAAGLRFNTRI
jgi:hypothetical protein